MFRVHSSDYKSTVSDVFYFKRLLAEHSRTRNNTPEVLNCIHLSGALAREVMTISSVASPKPQIVIIESD